PVVAPAEPVAGARRLRDRGPLGRRLRVAPAATDGTPGRAVETDAEPVSAESLLEPGHREADAGAAVGRFLAAVDVGPGRNRGRQHAHPSATGAPSAPPRPSSPPIA